MNLRHKAHQSDRNPALNKRIGAYRPILPEIPVSNDQINALRDMDNGAFSTLMGLYYSAMFRTALIYLKDPCAVEDVIQETWIAVLHGLGRFEGRSSLKTWIFSILINRAITRAKREGRFVPISCLLELEGDEFEPSVSPDHFNSQGRSETVFYGQLDSPSNSWDVIPEDNLLTQERLTAIHAAIRRLPPLQQRVINLRDVEGWSATEVCHALAISETNQRVILHRARAKVRQILDSYLRID